MCNVSCFILRKNCTSVAQSTIFRLVKLPVHSYYTFWIRQLVIGLINERQRTFYCSLPRRGGANSAVAALFDHKWSVWWFQQPASSIDSPGEKVDTTRWWWCSVLARTAFRL